ncbi:DUF1015 family protein [Streptomyces boninensis]|uniref:DUF1015 family protein n=1 Tax=Streptomyces boninensis TaxID=2039455 RepID=UPI003B226362
MQHSSGLDLQPFTGLRYAPARVRSLAAVTSPPYDVVVRPDGQDHLEQADPHNIVRLILPPTPEAAADMLRDWQAEGVLVPDPQPALYVYEQRRGELLQRGVVGALRLSAPEEGVVLPHEGVMEHIVADRANVMRATAANLEPLLLAYRSNGHAMGATAVIEQVAQRPPLLSTTTEDGFAHRLWCVTDPAELATVQKDLADRQAMIADGHHRWATYLRLRDERGAAAGPWDYGLVLLVDTARYPLEVKAIHRLLHSQGTEAVLRAVRGAFAGVRTVPGPVEDALAELERAAAAGPAFVLAGDGAYHLITEPDLEQVAAHVQPNAAGAPLPLDAAIADQLILGELCGIRDDGAEQVSHIHGAAAAVARAEQIGGTAVLMAPVSEDVVREHARRGVTMPRKSTSFGPKPATGLVLRVLGVSGVE